MAEMFGCVLYGCAQSSGAVSPTPWWLKMLLCRAVFSLAILSITLAILAENTFAVTSESPEVRELVEKGLNYLEINPEGRLGGKCLVALAFLKEGASPEHPRITEALQACQSTSINSLDDKKIYHFGLAIIFLSELNSAKHRSLIEQYATALMQAQKPHGGWGYRREGVGDTSQTQYAALSYWEMVQAGVPPKVGSVEKCLNWLLRTQDPSGVWGYHGNDSKDGPLVEQSKTSVSMLAAGLGSTLILGNVLGITSKNESSITSGSQEVSTASALKRVKGSSDKVVRTIRGNGVDKKRLAEAISKGQEWYDENFQISVLSSWHYPCYLLYSIERYKSFEELLTGNAPEEPKWYQDGFQYLQSNQAADGSWEGRSGKPCATAFAVLFLSRSTQKSIRSSLGEGTLVGGRGLLADLSKMKMNQGRLVADKRPAEMNQLLKTLEDASNEGLDSLLNNPSSLYFRRAGPEEARRLQQIVKSGVPSARLLSVRALSQLRDLDYVPTLLYAMTDPDHRVVREARDGLRFVSRRFTGFGLPDNFNETQRYDALDKWKVWYRRIRPDAPLLP